MSSFLFLSLCHPTLLETKLIKMRKYYVNHKAGSNGDHVVHHDACQYLPSLENRTYVGDFINCKDALQAAKKHYDRINGCKTCSYDCHTQ